MVSVIIPTYNRSRELSMALESIAGQHCSADFEVLVVDNGSSDQTKEVCMGFNTRIAGLRYFYEPEPGLLSARHHGVTQSRGEYLAFIDEDVQLNPNYISSLIGLFSADPEIKLATGPCLPAYESTPPDWLKWFWNRHPDGGEYSVWHSLIDLGNCRLIINPNFIFGLNFCIRKEVLLLLGGFHPDSVPAGFQQFQGDGETGLTMKASKRGYKAVYDPSLQLFHQIGNSRLTIEYFSKRAFYQGVCDSFTSIRQKNLEPEAVRPAQLSKKPKLLLGFGRLYNRITRSAKDSEKVPDIVLQIRSEIDNNYKKGFEFHTHAFKTDKRVQEWVLKDHYWNYKFPEGNKVGISPVLSIVIPTRNRCKNLAEVLDSIRTQNNATRFEVLVIDNGSSDQTLEVCKKFESILPDFKYFYEEEPGLLSGRHLGAKQSRGEYLVFLDDDVILNTGYIAAVIKLFSENPEVKLATGPCLPLYETEPPDWINYFWEKAVDSLIGQDPTGKFCSWFSLLDLGAKQCEINPIYVLGLNFCIRRSSFFELGGFHPDNIPERLQHFQGDGETGLTRKAFNAQYKAIYDPSLLVHHKINRERVTSEYFNKRAFYQGVCDSFTAIRLENSQPVKKFSKAIKRGIRRLFHSIRTFGTAASPLPEHVQQLKRDTARSYKNGYKFHSNSFKTDRLVREWVLKENYFDYRLPNYDR